MKHRLLLFHFTAWAWLLSAVLLCAQWVGLSHSITHGGQHNQAVLSLQMVAPYDQSPIPDRKYGPHSCIDFDAATLSDALQAGWNLLLPEASRHHLAPVEVYASWHGPVVLHFFSRGPPLA